MRTSTLRKYTCSNSSSGVISGRPRDRVLTTVGRSRNVLAGAVVSLLMSLVAIIASNCDIARQGAGTGQPRVEVRAGGRDDGGGTTVARPARTLEAAPLPAAAGP